MFIRSFFESFPCWQTPYQQEVFGFKPHEPLKSQVDDIVAKTAEVAKSEDPTRYVGILAERIPLRSFEAMLEAGVDSALTMSKAMLTQAQNYLKTCEHSHPITVRSVINSIIDSLLSAIDSVINAFGIASFFKPARYDYENSYKSHIFSGLISTTSLFIATVTPVLGYELSFILLGGVFILIAGISLFYQYVKPMPTSLIDTENWTKKAEFKQLERGINNETAVTALAERVQNHRWAFIKGSSGVGKTQLAKDLTYALAEGSEHVVKHLPHIKQVFYLNTVTLMASKRGDGITPLQKIKEALGRHLGSAMFVLDEFAATCLDPSKQDLVKSLLTEFDTINNVIAIGTDKEYDELIKKFPSLERRLGVPLQVKSLSKTDTQAVIESIHLQVAPQVIVEDKALEHLVDYYEKRFTQEFPESPLPQPLASKNILIKCLTQASSSQTLDASLECDRIRSEEEALRCKVNSLGFEALKKGNKELAELTAKCKEFEESKEKLAKAEKSFQTLLGARDNYYALTKSQQKTIIKINKLASKNLSHDAQQAKFYLLGLVLAKLKETIRKEAQELHVNMIVDEALVTKIVDTEIENLKASKQTV